jgi:cytochrome c
MLKSSVLAAAGLVASLVSAPLFAQAMPAGNAANGAKVFAQCKACHVTDKGVNRVGPSLHGIVGRKAGTVAGFNYSTANKNSGVTWDEKTLFVYLENPRKFMPGTKMAFAGLKQPQQRADVIAYLKTFK